MWIVLAVIFPIAEFANVIVTTFGKSRITATGTYISNAKTRRFDYTVFNTLNVFVEPLTTILKNVTHGSLISTTSVPFVYRSENAPNG